MHACTCATNPATPHAVHLGISYLAQVQAQIYSAVQPIRSNGPEEAEVHLLTTGLAVNKMRKPGSKPNPCTYPCEKFSSLQTSYNSPLCMSTHTQPKHLNRQTPLITHRHTEGTQTLLQAAACWLQRTAAADRQHSCMPSSGQSTAMMMPGGRGCEFSRPPRQWGHWHHLQHQHQACRQAYHQACRLQHHQHTASA